jgi:hypothetical protein
MMSGKLRMLYMTSGYLRIVSTTLRSLYDPQTTVSVPRHAETGQDEYAAGGGTYALKRAMACCSKH